MLLQKVDGLGRRLVDPKKKLEDLQLRNDDLLSRLEMAIQRRFENSRNKVKILEHRLVHPSDLITENRKEVIHLRSKMDQLMQRLIERKQARSQRAMAMLDSLSPLRVVDRGYSIVTKNKEVIKSQSQVTVGDQLQIRLADGELVAKVESVKGT